LLKIEHLRSFYGSIEALSDINIEVGGESIVCIIGANGAGKTTLLNSISGMVTRQGSITWNGEELINASPREIAKRGIAHVPEGRHIYPGLTVYQNLEVGTIPWHGFFGRKPYDEEAEAVYNLFSRLRERKNQLGWSLSGGEQQMLAIGRALMARPKLLLLDEPSMGLAPLIIDELFKKIIEINKEQKLPILLIEQNARLALDVSDYCYVLEHGKIAFHGPAKELRSDPRVVEAYLGRLAKAR